jgi:hypothetical protein
MNIPKLKLIWPKHRSGKRGNWVKRAGGGKEKTQEKENKKLIINK